MQAAHAALQYAREYPGDWHAGALVILTAPDEYALHDLMFRLLTAGHKAGEFWEPDVGELTAIAAGPEAGQMLRHLPLALSDTFERG